MSRPKSIVDYLEHPIWSRLIPKKVQDYARLALHAMEAVDEGLVFTTPDNTITRVNQGFLDMYGFEESSEIVGRNIEILRSSNSNSSDLSEIILREADSQKGWKGEVWNTTRDGREILVDLSVSVVLRHEDGSPRRYMGLVRNITGAKERDRLTALGDATDAVAHDMRGPLTAITGLVGLLLRDDSISDKNKGFLGHVQQSALNLNNVLDSTRRFAKGEYELEPLNLSKYATFDIKGIRGEDYGRIIINHKVTSEVLADDSTMYRVLTNLVNNAIHAVDESGVIRVGSEDVTIQEPKDTYSGTMPPGNYVQLSVSDNGCGISDSQVTRIFDRGVTTWGNGIGLSVVKRVVEGHGAYLDVHSVEGEGTTFDIYFLPAGERNE